MNNYVLVGYFLSTFSTLTYAGGDKPDPSTPIEGQTPIAGLGIHPIVIIARLLPTQSVLHFSETNKELHRKTKLVRAERLASHLEALLTQLPRLSDSNHENWNDGLERIKNLTTRLIETQSNLLPTVVEHLPRAVQIILIRKYISENNLPAITALINAGSEQSFNKEPNPWDCSGVGDWAARYNHPALLLAVIRAHQSNLTELGDKDRQVSLLMSAVAGNSADALKVVLFNVSDRILIQWLAILLAETHFESEDFGKSANPTMSLLFSELTLARIQEALTRIKGENQHNKDLHGRVSYWDERDETWGERILVFYLTKGPVALM